MSLSYYKFRSILFLLIIIEKCVECSKTHLFKNYTIVSSFVQRKDNLELANIINVKSNKTMYQIMLQNQDLESLHIVNNNYTKIFINDELQTNNFTLNHYGDYVRFVKGHLTNEKLLYSAAEGIIIDNERFFGKIYDNEAVYYVEELKKFPNILKKFQQESNATSLAILYQKEDLIDNLQSFAYDFTTTVLNKSDYDSKNQSNQQNNRRYKRTLSFKERLGNICPMLVIADYSYYKIIGNKNLKLTIMQVISSINEANSIFRITDFDNDGIPDNIGFSIKYLTVITDPGSSLNFLPYNETAVIEGKKYIYFFSHYRLLKDVCLGVAFTAQLFTENTLGVSYLALPLSNVDIKTMKAPRPGGICSRPAFFGNGFNYNSMAVSARVERNKAPYIVPQILFDLALAHEIAHSFGADHDDGTKCPSMLMASSGHKGNVRKNFILSECSKEQIRKVIPDKGSCLIKDDTPFCGNGLVEMGEECDCGLNIDCIEKDPCCRSPDTGHINCKVLKSIGFNCHPSQGLCCLDNCTFNNIDLFGLHCSKINDKCPCDKSASSCECGLLGECVGTECHAMECTRIGLNECICPPNPSRSFCTVCCTDPRTGDCKLVETVTQHIIFRNHLIFYDLRNTEKAKVYPKKFGFFRRLNFTNHNRNASVVLQFPAYKKFQYCFSQGRIGRCNEKFVCDINSKLPIDEHFPNKDKINKTILGSIAKDDKISLKNFSMKTNFIWIVYLFILFVLIIFI